MPKGYNEYGVMTPEFIEAMAPIHQAIHDHVGSLMDQGYSAADIHYAIASGTNVALAREGARRTMERRMKKT